MVDFHAFVAQPNSFLTCTFAVVVQSWQWYRDKRAQQGKLGMRTTQCNTVQHSTLQYNTIAATTAATTAATSVEMSRTVMVEIVIGRIKDLILCHCRIGHSFSGQPPLFVVEQRDQNRVIGTVVARSVIRVFLGVFGTFVVTARKVWVEIFLQRRVMRWFLGGGGGGRGRRRG